MQGGSVGCMHVVFQLIHECKEVLKAGVIVKQYYQVMVQAVMWNDEVGAEENFERDLERFDDDMKAMLKVLTRFFLYFTYYHTCVEKCICVFRYEFFFLYVFQKKTD